MQLSKCENPENVQLNITVNREVFEKFEKYIIERGIARKIAIERIMEDAVKFDVFSMKSSEAQEKKIFTRDALIKTVISVVQANACQYEIISQQGGVRLILTDNYVIYMVSKNLRNESNVVQIKGTAVKRLKALAEKYNVEPLIILGFNNDKDSFIVPFNPEKLPVSEAKNHEYSAYRTKFQDIFLRTRNSVEIQELRTLYKTSGLNENFVYQLNQ